MIADYQHMGAVGKCSMCLNGKMLLRNKARRRNIRYVSGNFSGSSTQEIQENKGRRDFYSVAE